MLKFLYADHNDKTAATYAYAIVITQIFSKTVELKMNLLAITVINPYKEIY